MQRKSNIKWRKNDIKEVERLVRNFNAKIDYQLKHHSEKASYLPSKINKKEFIAKIDTRQDFNREMKSLMRFSEKGSTDLKENKHGLKITNWEYKEVVNKTRVINAQRTKQRKKILADKPTERGVMGSLKENSLRPKKVNFEKKSPKEWDLSVMALEKQIRGNYTHDKADMYKENYLKAIDNILGEKGDKIKDIIIKIPSDFLYESYNKDALFQIDFIYDPLQAEAIAEAIYEKWLEEIENSELEIEVEDI